MEDKNILFEDHPFNDIEKIANDSSEGSDSGGGSSTSGSLFVNLTITYDENYEVIESIETDKSYNEILSAFTTGKVVQCYSSATYEGYTFVDNYYFKTLGVMFSDDIVLYSIHLMEMRNGDTPKTYDLVTRDATQHLRYVAPVG